MVAVSLFHYFIFNLPFSVYFQILNRMANVSIAEKNMVGLPVKGEEEEEEEEEAEDEEGEEEEGMKEAIHIMKLTSRRKMSQKRLKRVSNNHLLQVICHHHGMIKLKR